MANSSDWIAQAGVAGPTAPGWLAALDQRDGFSASSPFGVSDEAVLAAPPENALSEPESAPAEDRIAQAFAEGEAAGRAAASAEAEAALASQRTLRLALRAFDQATLDAFASDLSDTVMALCSQVIAEHTIDSDALMERCRLAAKRIGDVARQCTLRLHPDDIALIDPTGLGDVAIEPDGSLERGSLVLDGPDGAVRDGPAEWRRAIAAALQK